MNKHASLFTSQATTETWATLPGFVWIMDCARKTHKPLALGIFFEACIAFLGSIGLRDTVLEKWWNVEMSFRDPCLSMISPAKIRVWWVWSGPWDGAGLLGKHARVFGMPRPQISTCSYPWDVFQNQPLPCTLSLFGLVLALPRGLLGCMVRYGEIWWDMALECFPSSFFGLSCLPWSNWAWRSEGLRGYQVKNMGGIGAHCAEDYETLKMFVEAPSTYKDEPKTCWWQKPSGILFHWVDDSRCMGNWTDKYWQGNLVYLSSGTKDSNPTVAHCFSRSFVRMKIHPDTASRGQQTWARKCQIIQVRLLNAIVPLSC